MGKQRIKGLKKNARAIEAKHPSFANDKVKSTGNLEMFCDEKLLGPTYIKDLDKQLKAPGIVADLFEEDSICSQSKPKRRSLQDNSVVSDESSFNL